MDIATKKEKKKRKSTIWMVKLGNCLNREHQTLFPSYCLCVDRRRENYNHSPQQNQLLVLEIKGFLTRLVERIPSPKHVWVSTTCSFHLCLLYMTIFVETAEDEIQRIQKLDYHNAFLYATQLHSRAADVQVCVDWLSRFWGREGPLAAQSRMQALPWRGPGGNAKCGGWVATLSSTT